jgi:integrase
MKLAEIDATGIEAHLRNRLKQRRRVRRKSGVIELGLLKPATVHQEFRVLRRILSVAVKKKLCPANPCAGVEFPVILKGLFRPHYVTASEQVTIEQHSPAYLRNVIRILTETGLRVYKELASMRKDQVDLANKTIFISDSKTPTGVAEVPLTDIAVEAFRSQIGEAGPGPISAKIGRSCHKILRWAKIGLPIARTFCVKNVLILALMGRDPGSSRVR